MLLFCYFEGFHWNDTLEDFEREIWKVMDDNSDNNDGIYIKKNVAF